MRILSSPISLIHSYFVMRFHPTIPQAIVNVLTLLGSYSPRSFASTRTHAQHLHHLVTFALSIFQKPFVQAYLSAYPDQTIDTGMIENDTKEKIRAVLLLKTILCTMASGVMLFLPSWANVVQGMRSVIDILLQVCFISIISIISIMMIINDYDNQ